MRFESHSSRNYYITGSLFLGRGGRLPYAQRCIELQRRITNLQRCEPESKQTLSLFKDIQGVAKKPDSIV